MNLFAQDLLGTPMAMLLSLVIGLGFGFWLERAGFGSSRKLTAIFYYRDFAVLKVMFAAMVTAALGLQLAAAVGAVDPHELFVPASVVWPQVVGGVVFGIGFVAGGWCPGTAAVGLASGKVDALVFLVGAGAGSLAFAALAPGFGDFLQAGTCDVGAATTALGISDLTGAVALTGIALAAFVGATQVERIMARRTAQ
ncbi:MAG: DUF6691 family protein [Planctomycetota bacterium]